MNRRNRRRTCGGLAVLLVPLLGCPNTGNNTASPPVFNNTTDPTNGGAAYVGAAACGACHAELSALNALHGHAQAAAGVSCETCHGPGSNHLPDPAARLLFVDSTSQTCGRCHLAGDDERVIRAADGYIDPSTQLAELRASGGHAAFECTYCHDPHASTVNDRSNGIRNACTACHSTANMAAHGGLVFVRGDYSEPLTCESCHMPFAGRRASSAGPELVGALGRMGDARAHIFRVDLRNVDYTAMFSADGGQVVLDDEGRAAVTVDFVCLRCHTDETAAENSAFPLSIDSAWQIGTGLHRLPQ